MTNAETLRPPGWSDDIAERLAPMLDGGRLTPGRIVRVDRGEVDVALGAGHDRDVLRCTSTTAAKDCVAGDWAAVDVDAARAEGVMPRVSAFVRRAARGALAAQTLAANMDVVFVVQGLEPGVNVRRLERELVLAHQSGATPIVLLTKADLVDRAVVETSLAAVRAVAPNVAVFAVSNRTGEGLDEVAAQLEPGRTFALLGSSGVGKSTFVNAFAGEQVQLEGEIRDGDGKGRHTTTAARLIELADGRLLLDTPGVRALALWESWEGLADTFPEIESTAERCGFADCFHDDEPRCAVVAAVEAGEIPAERLESWRALRDEMAALDAELVDQQRRADRPGRPERG